MSKPSRLSRCHATEGVATLDCMIGRTITAVVALGILVIALLVMLPEISQLLEAARTDASTETGLTCNTGASTSCSITLAAAHQYATTAAMTVTETSPGSVDRTGATSIAANSVTLTVAGLTTSTAYTFTVDYAIQAANVGDGTADLLRVFMPVLAILLVAALLLGTIVGGLSLGRARK